MRLYSFLFLIAFALLVAGCAGMKPESFQNGTPVLEPDKFFAGRTKSYGVFENRRGKPAQRITTETQGTMKDGVLYIEQDLSYEKGKRQHRSWQMRRIDAHHVDATANDIIGTAHGLAYGNMFCWQFRLAAKSGNPLTNVRMYQSMYLEADGKTLVLRSIIRKSGIFIAAVTEQFRKE